MEHEVYKIRDSKSGKYITKEFHNMHVRNQGVEGLSEDRGILYKQMVTAKTTLHSLKKYKEFDFEIITFTLIEK